VCLDGKQIMRSRYIWMGRREIRCGRTRRHRVAMPSDTVPGRVTTTGVVSLSNHLDRRDSEIIALTAGQRLRKAAQGQCIAGNGQASQQTAPKRSQHRTPRRPCGQRPGSLEPVSSIPSDPPKPQPFVIAHLRAKRKPVQEGWVSRRAREIPSCRSGMPPVRSL
jgi:hypothetical protein